MTTIDTGATPRSTPFFTGTRLARLVARLSEIRAERALRRETWRQLDRLTDRELDDIGLTRGDVTALR